MLRRPISDARSQRLTMRWFHLLIEDGRQRWLGGSPVAEIGVQRAFDHGPMKAWSLLLNRRFGRIGAVRSFRYLRRSGRWPKPLSIYRKNGI